MVKSDLIELPTEAIRSALCETVENQLKSKNYKINVSSASQNGENNFIGVLHRISFSKKGADEGEKGGSLVLKVAPQDLMLRDKRFSRPSFMREIHMYDKVLPALRKFEKSKGVTEENVFNEYPKCYRTVDVEVSESVLLEDMSVRGFRMVDRHTEETTSDHVRLVMQAFGKLHAISFAMKDQQPQRFEELTSSLDEVFIIRENEQRRSYFSALSGNMLEVVSGEEDANLLARLKKLLVKEPMDIAADCIDSRITESVIIHGDTWQNNFMFRFDKKGTPVEISLLDWQISRRSSPIIDIVYYIFCSTTKDLRDAHYDEFLKIYHDSLSAHIRRLGSDPEKLFPFKLMLEHLRKFGRYGLVVAALLLPIITKELGHRPDLDPMTKPNEDNGTIVQHSIKSRYVSDKTRAKFEKRLKDVIIDMVRLGYI